MSSTDKIRYIYISLKVISVTIVANWASQTNQNSPSQSGGIGPKPSISAPNTNQAPRPWEIRFELLCSCSANIWHPLVLP